MSITPNTKTSHYGTAYILTCECAYIYDILHTEPLNYLHYYLSIAIIFIRNPITIISYVLLGHLQWIS